MAKRFFAFASQKICGCPLFCFFHTISIWSQYLELYTTLNIKASYKKSSDDFFIELDFQKVIFSQRKHFTKIQKKGMRISPFLALVFLFWWKNQQGRPESAKSMNLYQNLRVFFNVKNLRIFYFFSNSDFTIRNLNLSQLWGKTRISTTYSIKYPFCA